MILKFFIRSFVLFSTTLIVAQEDSNFLVTDTTTTVSQLSNTTTTVLPLWVYSVVALCIISVLINLILSLKLHKTKQIIQEEQLQNLNTLPSTLAQENSIPPFKNLAELVAFNQNIPLSRSMQHLQALCTKTTDFTYVHSEIWKSLDAVLGFQSPFFQNYYQYHQMYWKNFTEQFGATRRLVLQGKEQQLSKIISQTLTNDLLLGGLHALEYAYGVTGQFHIVPALSSQNNIKLIQLNTTIKHLPPSTYEVFSNSIQKSSAGEVLMQQWLQEIGLKSTDRILIQNRYYSD